MSESALSALYKALNTTLRGAGGIWGSEVHANAVAPEISRPYCIFAVVGGGEENALKHADARFVVTVKCVADSLQDAMIGGDAIATALNDKGEREVSGGVSGGTDWYIHTITQERVIMITEQWEMVQDIHHCGHQFSVHMESK